MSSRKRKHRRSSPDYGTGGEGTPSEPSSSSMLFVQAHEATIIRDRPDIARALTTRDHGGGKGGLIQWHADSLEGDREVWMDRYDARLLLTSFPTADPRFDDPVRSPPSPTGWSDLPSDSEDTFFFSPGEIEDFRREKRRKLMATGREERLRAMRESDPDPARELEEDRELWGDDDEEPEDAQRTLMERTAKHLLSSPNPGQLEMRILANHGTDLRFAFLRGRWRNMWQAIKLAAKVENEELQRKAIQAKENTGGGLVAYGDSDDSDDGEREESEKKAILTKHVDETEKEARRARAREWAQKRKESKMGKE